MFSLNSPTSSLTNIYKHFPIPNPFQQITTKELQTEINELKAQVRYLKTEVMNVKTADLTLEAKLALLEAHKSGPAIPLSIPVGISRIPDTEIPTTQFLQTISKITFQKWYSIVTLVLEDISVNAIALIDSDADLNCIKGGVIPTKYCERTSESLASANGEPLSINYKLDKGYIKNNGYCFKNTFLIVDNITNGLFFGTQFLTQVYPFYVNETGVHTKIMGKPISFTFLSAKTKGSC